MRHGTTHAYQYYKCRCSKCRLAKSLEGKKHWHKTRIAHRAAVLRRIYGLTTENYMKMEIEQKGVCAICSKVCSSGKVLGVDHDHSTGRVRGLLCTNCNGKLGWYEQYAAEANDYLIFEQEYFY